MFQDLVVSNKGRGRTNKPWTVAVSAVAQAALWGILILVPLIYTEALPNGMLKTLIVAPPPPVTARRQAPVRNERVRLIPLNSITAPRFVPRGVYPAGQELPVEYVNRESSGDTSNPDELTDLLHSSGPLPPSTPPAKENLQPIRVGGNVEAASLIHRVVPQYPEIAMLTHVSGIVVLRALIAKDGSVQELSYVSGPPLLIKPAMEAVRQWRYRPTQLNGKPVEVDTTINVVFTLGS